MQKVDAQRVARRRAQLAHQTVAHLRALCSGAQLAQLLLMLARQAQPAAQHADRAREVRLLARDERRRRLRTSCCRVVAI